MASVAVTNITNITRSITGLKGNASNEGGLPVEYFRIAAGQTAGDTAVLTPSTFASIRAVIGPCTDNLPTTGTGATSVTITLGLVQGTAITSTIGAVTVRLVGPVPTS
jgi:hypothetical protein